MKTAISVPDDVFESADELASEMGVSRSALYSTAMAEFLAKHRGSDITAKLNEVYGEVEGRLPAEFRRAQAKTIGKSEW